ncbi:hypothetical protein CLF_112045 [Clonorchis sinensis]|uniref:Endonuclease/exonuclease/phosphatase domain-containing protein n=1 Tax=Clonorchis sinensis TaxID=79923 RepID=G7YVQ8_CLOSI|nr:hypothetical protein CLF_112045 [Clonorchis sinensis]
MDARKNLRIWLSSNMSFSFLPEKPTQEIFAVPRMIQRTFSHSTRMDFQIPYWAYVRPLLEYVNPVFYPGHTKDVTLIGRVQRAATKMVAGLKSVDYEARLAVLVLFPLEYPHLRRHVRNWFRFSIVQPPMVHNRCGRNGSQSNVRREKAIKNKTKSPSTNQTVQCKCSSLIGVLAAKLELLSKALTDANTKNAAPWTKVDKELSSLNEYLALCTPGPLAAKEVIQLSDAAIKTATASLVDRRKILKRAVSIQKAYPTTRRLSEDRPLEERNLGHSSSREEARKRLQDGASSADPKLKAKPSVVIAPCAPENTPRQTTATLDKRKRLPDGASSADPKLKAKPNDKGAAVNTTPNSQLSWIGSDERSQAAKPTGKPTICTDLDIGECCENRSTTETVKLPISSSTPTKVSSLIVDTAVAQGPDSQSLKPDHGEPESPSYTQLVTLIAGDSDVHASAKQRRLQPNKPYTIRQIRKLLAGFKVQSSEETSLMGAPPKELLGAATQRSKPQLDTFSIKPRQNIQETKQTQICLNSLNSKFGRPKGVIESATSNSGRNFRPPGRKLQGYSVFRADSKREKAGGIALYLPAAPSAPIVFSDATPAPFCDALWIQVPLRGSDSLLLVVVYCSPSSPPEDDRFPIRTLEQLSSSYHFTHLLLAGDFNAPKASWMELQRVGSSGLFAAALTEVIQHQIPRGPTTVPPGFGHHQRKTFR